MSYPPSLNSTNGPPQGSPYASGNAGAPSTGPPSLEMIATMALSHEKGINLGPQIMGLAFDSVMCGIVIHQFVCWTSSARTEKKHVKWLLIWSVVTALITTIYTWAWIFHLYVYGFGEYAPFMTFHYMAWFNILDNATIFAVQIFFAERAYVLNKRNKLLLGSIVFCLIFRLVGATGSTVTMYTADFLHANSVLINAFVYMTPSATAITDIIITGSISWALMCNKTGWSDTDALLTKLMVLTIEAQVPGTLIALGSLIELCVKYRSYVGAFFQIILAKPYILGFLAVLNSRDSWRKNGVSTGGRGGVFAHPLGTNQQDTVMLDTAPFSYYNSRMDKDVNDIALGQGESRTDVTNDEGRSIERREKEHNYL